MSTSTDIPTNAPSVFASTISNTPACNFGYQCENGNIIYAYYSSKTGGCLLPNCDGVSTSSTSAPLCNFGYECDNGNIVYAYYSIEEGGCALPDCDDGPTSIVTLEPSMSDGETAAPTTEPIEEPLSTSDDGETDDPTNNPADVINGGSLNAFAFINMMLALVYFL